MRPNLINMQLVTKGGGGITLNSKWETITENGINLLSIINSFLWFPMNKYGGREKKNLEFKLSQIISEKFKISSINIDE